jgi:hypothetical protein
MTVELMCACTSFVPLDMGKHFGLVVFISSYYILLSIGFSGWQGHTLVGAAMLHPASFPKSKPEKHRFCDAMV